MDIQAVSGAAVATQSTQKETDDERKFLQMLEEFDAYLESQRPTDSEKRAEQQARAEKRLKERKISELRARITALRTKANMGHQGAERELSGLQTQQMHLLMFG